MPTPRPWALGWLADREWFIEVGRLLGLCKGPDADNKNKLEAAALHYVIGDTRWPNVMMCVVDGTTELVFAVYVDYKRRPYPPTSIPRSELLSRRYCNRLEKYMLLDDDPQWFTCEDGSYTPWRYGCQDPNPNAIWMDVSRYQPHPDAEYDRIEVVEEENGVEEYHKEDLVSGIVDVGEDGQEYIDADYIEESHAEEGSYVGVEYVEGADVINVEVSHHSHGVDDDDLAYDDVEAALFDDENSVVIRSDMEHTAESQLDQGAK
ncbi:hypothetical protein FOMPIDRAFT_88104 [Fomitopsis schrenkii]|uniref:Uncharacterized protein n=1 Tax=Fomitopsis schrenkii TaxID=2126942 RepID=S8FGU6_FOMSC|nr:hypothetical protein FOMPIDRAFT_88104 [Fomitopsis schrenkii]